MLIKCLKKDEKLLPPKQDVDSLWVLNSNEKSIDFVLKKLLFLTQNNKGFLKYFTNLRPQPNPKEEA